MLLRLKKISGNPFMGGISFQIGSSKKVNLRFGGLRQYSQGRIVLKYLYRSWGFFNRGFRGILSVMRVRIRSLQTVWLISLNL